MLLKEATSFRLTFSIKSSMYSFNNLKEDLRRMVEKWASNAECPKNNPWCLQVEDKGACSTECSCTGKLFYFFKTFQFDEKVNI